MVGKVFIASMNMRGKWAEPLQKDTFKINVTSMQSKNNKNRINFSPMTEIVNGYKGYWNFENYWQSGKVFEDISIEESKKYWKELKQAKRRYPNSKNKKVLYALFDEYTEKMDYITSRKKIYVPQYYDLIKDKELIIYWKDKIKQGYSITIYDFDGPRNENGDPICVEFSEELLIDKINDIKFPFGHGYIVGSTLLDININKYINLNT